MSLQVRGIRSTYKSNAITSAIYIDNFGSIAISVTRLGDFLHFGQEFKSGGNSYFKQIANIVIQFL